MVINNMEKKSGRLTYKHTLYACFTGYIVQAIVNNFVPLLFLTFHSNYGISMSRITFLVTFNFGLQMIIDFISPKFIDFIGYRLSAIIAHILAASGLIMLTILPEYTANPFTGLLISILIYAVGGGLIEVLISPIVEACPTDNKEMAMSMLHSFYCWGHVAVVLFTTLFFFFAGVDNWKYMAIFWALIPIANIFLFFKVPINHLIEDGQNGLSLKSLVCNKFFWIMILLMVCSGASEQAVSQWASSFAELGLGVSKTIGDLAGPMFFATMMGISRAIYGKFGDRINLEKFMIYSTFLCIATYFLITLSPWPILGLLGCGLCGLSVGIMWPGTFSLASSKIKNGGTMMFAFFALSGDIGCSAGPTMVGMVSSAFKNNLNIGILSAVIFPFLLLIGIGLNRRLTSKSGRS